MQLFYHGSDYELPKGETLVNCVDYEGKWGSSAFYRGLEAHRPKGFRPHSKSVFFVKDFEDLEYAGGGEDFTFLIVPKGSVSRHDMFWSSRVTALVDEGHDIESDKVKEAASNYWYGVESDNPAWEYTCDKAKILRVYSWEHDGTDIENEKNKLEERYSSSKIYPELAL